MRCLESASRRYEAERNSLMLGMLMVVPVVLALAAILGYVLEAVR